MGIEELRKQLGLNNRKRPEETIKEMKKELADFNREINKTLRRNGGTENERK